MSQGDARARENLCCSLSSLIFSTAATESCCQSATPDFAFQVPSLAHCMSWDIPKGCNHRRTQSKTAQKISELSSRTGAGRGENFCHTSPSPTATWEKVIKGNGHSLTVAGLFLFVFSSLSGWLVLTTAVFLIQLSKGHLKH